MGFFDNLGKKASAAYDATAEKTGKLAKEAKLKMKINENKSEIKEIYKEIGRKVYEKHVREENINIKTELEEECTKIDVLSAEIETCLKSILELKQKKQCEKCHAEIELNAKFCSKCGEKQPESEVLNAEIVKEDLEKAEVKPENQQEAKIVEEEVSGDTLEEIQLEDVQNIENAEAKDSNNVENKNEEEILNENNNNTAESSENTVERVTEIMAVETQEESKKENE